jgi:hypothetical protein
VAFDHKKDKKELYEVMSGIKFGINFKKGPGPDKSKKVTNLGSGFGIGFGDDESGDEGEEDGTSGQNSDIKRANNYFMNVTQFDTDNLPEAPIDGGCDTSIYDYDGAYDAMHIERERLKNERANLTTKDQNKNGEEPKSRYITGLLSMAKVREREKERIQEKRLLEERKTEEAELGGPTEKFVTEKYRRKLEETAQWKELEKAAEIREAEDDVRMRKTGMNGFFSNLARNTALGGVNAKSETRPMPKEENETKVVEIETSKEVLQNREYHAEQDRGLYSESDNNINMYNSTNTETLVDVKGVIGSQNNVSDPWARGEMREKLITEAKERYFRRKQCGKG